MIKFAMTWLGLLALASLLLFVASKKSDAETIYSVTGTTLLNADGSGKILGVSGTLIGDDIAGDLVGTLTIDTVGSWPVDAGLVALSGAVPPFSPAIGTLLSPDSSGPTLAGDADGLSINPIDFGRVDPWSYETLGSWDTLLTYFGSATDSPIGANLQIVEVTEPSTGLLGLLGCLAIGFLRRRNTN